MSTLTSAPAATPNLATGPRTAVTAAGLVGALASAAYISGVIFMTGLTDQEAQRAPITVVECLLTGLAYIALAVSLPSLAPVTRLPRWALTAAAVACAFVALQAWTLGTAVADAGWKLPAEEFAKLNESSLLFGLMLHPMGVAAVVGFGALAVTGWRRRAMSRGACVLLAVAALAALMGPFPPAGLLAGLALAWTARSAR